MYENLHPWHQTFPTIKYPLSAYGQESMKTGKNFGDIPREFSAREKAAIAVVPVPYDGTSTWMKGADRGPAAIVEASANMELYDTETGTEVYRRGIFTDAPVTEKKTPKAMADAVHRRVTGHLERNAFTVTIGGEHSVSIGAARAHHDRFGGLSVLQLDAHADLRESYNGSRFNHACVMRRMMEHSPVTQVGIRSMDISETGINDERIFFADEIHKSVDWISRAVDTLSGDVYVTIDLDVFDVPYMPSTGTPEPGGLDWTQVTGLLRQTARERRIVGFDVVELCPNRTSSPYDFLAAKLIYKTLSYVFEEK